MVLWCAKQGGIFGVPLFGKGHKMEKSILS